MNGSLTMNTGRERQTAFFFFHWRWPPYLLSDHSVTVVQQYHTTSWYCVRPQIIKWTCSVILVCAVHVYKYGWKYAVEAANVLTWTVETGTSPCLDGESNLCYWFHSALRAEVSAFVSVKLCSKHDKRIKYIVLCTATWSEVISCNKVKAWVTVSAVVVVQVAILDRKSECAHTHTHTRARALFTLPFGAVFSWYTFYVCLRLVIFLIYYQQNTHFFLCLCTLWNYKFQS